MGKFIGRLLITPVEGKRELWELQEGLTYITNDGEKIDMPILFHTDGYSIPKLLQPIFGAPLIDCPEPAVLHDWLYKTGMFSRLKSDLIFLEAMKTKQISLAKRKGRYRGVRIGGWIAWNRHRRIE